MFLLFAKVAMFLQISYHMTPVIKGFKGQFLDDLTTRPVVMNKVLTYHAFCTLGLYLDKYMIVRESVFMPLQEIPVFTDHHRWKLPGPRLTLLDLQSSFQVSDKVSYQLIILCVFPGVLTVFEGFSIIG
ncbi:hypothetical protein ES703_81039 [subsurface metagenome]